MATINLGRVLGKEGIAGQDGAPGKDGQGVPSGGTTGQILVKTSNTDFGTAWMDKPTYNSSEITYGNSNVGSAINGLRSSIESLLPSVTASDAGKFLRVNSTGTWSAESVPNASGVSF